MSILNWEKYPYDNDDSDSANGIEWLSRQPAPQANNSARAMMAEIRKDFDYNHGTTGYQNFPGGIIQWGSVTTSSLGGARITFPKQFLATPVVTLTMGNSTISDLYNHGFARFSGSTSITTQRADLTAVIHSASSPGYVVAGLRQVYWRAIGPR